MRRSIAFCLWIYLIVLLGCCVPDMAEKCGFCVFADLRAGGEAVERGWQQRDDFVPRLDKVRDEVALGRMSLREASCLLERIAEEHYPAFLDHIEVAEYPGTIRTKLAHNLLRHVKADVTEREGAAHADQRFAELAREYAAIAATETSQP